MTPQGDRHRMRAIAIDSFGDSSRLTETDLPRPDPAPGEVLIRTVAAGVNPADWKIREGWVRDHFPHEFPLVPGWDVAGVVEEPGPGPSRFRKGDKVWACAIKPVVRWGTYAEFVAVDERHVSPVPAKLLFEEAAAVPLAGLTARQLVIAGGVEAGKTVLVLGAAGGVGHLTVQLARYSGARVFGTCSSGNREFVLGLGAEGAFDYNREDFREALRRHVPGGVDLAIDLVGGDVQRAGLDTLAPAGTLLSTVHEPDTRGSFLSTRPDGCQLERLARLIDRGKLRVHVEKIYPLARAGEAQDRSKAGHVRGKLVLAL